jgi:hypothetical protein
MGIHSEMGCATMPRIGESSLRNRTLHYFIASRPSLLRAALPEVVRP